MDAELERQARELYEKKAEYLKEVEPIVSAMVRLKMIFASPRVVIDVGEMIVEEEWIDTQAAALYGNYEALLDSIQDRYMAANPSTPHPPAASQSPAL